MLHIQIEDVDDVHELIPRVLLSLAILPSPSTTQQCTMKRVPCVLQRKGKRKLLNLLTDSGEKSSARALQATVFANYSLHLFSLKKTFRSLHTVSGKRRSERPKDTWLSSIS